MQQIRSGEVEVTIFFCWARQGQQLISTSRTISESELHGTKLISTFFKERINNGFKAPLDPVDFVAACDMRSDGPGGGFCSAAAKKMETKMCQKAENVFKEKK